MTTLQPPCPACQTRTILADIASGPAGFDIRTFECAACGLVYRREAGIFDPMRSAETGGWLRGELRAPT